MKTLCAECNICFDFMPEQPAPRELVISNDEMPKEILVIDDAHTEMNIGMSMLTINEMLGARINFDYTSTIRCSYKSAEVEEVDLEVASARCSVWTHSLLENRKVILATKRGLKQMGIEGREEGDMYKSGKFGLILVMPPLVSPRMTDDYDEYKTKMRRILREAGV